jgi:acyl-coenzyme A thioesterase PaaI-like protein
MKLIYQMIDKLLATPTPLNVLALDKVLRVGIPFNAPHSFKILRLGPEEVAVALPNKKLNHNHLGGVHACAMATVGEYAAGLALLSSFGITRYRLILAELTVRYTYQGRVDLEARCAPDQIDVAAVRAGLETEGRYLQRLTTVIRERAGKEVAVVETVWQLKPWEQVKTK